MRCLRILFPLWLAAVVAAMWGEPLTVAAPGDMVADRVFGQGGSLTSGTGNLGGITESSMCLPWGVVMDNAGNLYVAEECNNRVLEFDSPLTTDMVADRVFGQGGSFTSGTCNLGGISADSLCKPHMVAVDPAGNLYVADMFNNRVLEYDSPLTTDTAADRVFGQGGSLTSGTCNLGGTSANSLCNPFAVAVDVAGNLYIGDSGNRRVLEYDIPLGTDTVADRVFGQGGSFTTDTCNLGGIGASSLCGPGGLGVGPVGSLYVSDGGNHRVLEYDSPLTSDTLADRVFGQPNLTTGGGPCVPPSASTMCYPNGVTVDAIGNLYVVDHQNGRVLEYDSPVTTDQVPDRVFGKPNFTTGEPCVPPSDSSLCRPLAAVVGAGNLYVTDHNNHRVLEYDCPVVGDSDGDTRCNPYDNCQLVANPGQENLDGDSLGDACDPDDDNDGVGDSDEPPCGSDPMDITPPLSRPERTDGAFAGVDDDGDTQIDEALPGGAAAFDCDGDGYRGSAESGGALCGNGVNDDAVVFGGSDDGVVDDGCPGGPGQAGAFSEGQFNIGLGDQDPCGTNGWPSDFASGGIPDSTNRVNVLDLTSFLAPSRRLDTSPGHANFDDRWDLVPGRGLFTTWIAVNDLTALLAGSSGFPPMLGGAKAFNHPMGCPWPG